MWAHGGYLEVTGWKSKALLTRPPLSHILPLVDVLSLVLQELIQSLVKLATVLRMMAHKWEGGSHSLLRTDCIGPPRPPVLASFIA